MNILHVCANPKPTEEAISKQLASAFFGKLIELKPEVELINVDLYDEKPRFLVMNFIKEYGIPFLILNMSQVRLRKCLQTMRMRKLKNLIALMFWC